MSLYTRLFGENKHADELLDMLGLTRGDFGRFRDIFPTADGSQIVVYARIGANNAKYFENQYKHLGMHPQILYAKDDDYDPTYHTITFTTPAEHRKRAAEIADGQEPESVHAKFQRFEQVLKSNDRDSELYQRHLELEKIVAPQMQKLATGDNTTLGIFDSDTPEDLRPGDEVITI